MVGCMVAGGRVPGSTKMTFHYHLYAWNWAWIAKVAGFFEGVAFSESSVLVPMLNFYCAWLSYLRLLWTPGPVDCAVPIPPAQTTDCTPKYVHGNENMFIYPATVCVYITNLECPGSNLLMFIQGVIHPVFQHPMILLSMEICPKLFEITKLLPDFEESYANEVTSRWLPQCNHATSWSAWTEGVFPDDSAAGFSRCVLAV